MSVSRYGGGGMFLLIHWSETISQNLAFCVSTVQTLTCTRKGNSKTFASRGGRDPNRLLSACSLAPSAGASAGTAAQKNGGARGRGELSEVREGGEGRRRH